MNIKRLLCSLALLLCVQAAVAAAPAEKAPAKRDATTFTEKDINEITSPIVLQRMVAGYQRLDDQKRLSWTLARLSELNPDSGDLRMALALSYAKQGDKSKTYDLLLKMKEQGYGVDLSDDPRFEKVTGTEAWDYVIQNLNSNLKPFGEGKVAFELPRGDTLFESIAWDPKRQEFLVGSVREGKIYLADKNGKLKEFITPADGSGLWSVYAMAVDSARDLLYVTSSSSLYFKGFRKEDFNKTGIFKFKLSTGKLVDKIVLPTDKGTHILSSITVGKDGKVFVADGVRNQIFTIEEGNKLKLLVANPRLTSIRGLAVSDDGNTLYFADYALGLFGADLKSGTGFPVAHDTAHLVLGGIEGLYWYDGTLVAIENGMWPKRVIRLSLTKDGKGITKMMPLDVANPAFDIPTNGTIAGDGLYYIANSQKKLYGQYGDLKNEKLLQPVRIFRSNLRFAWNENGINASGLMPARKASPEEAKKMLGETPSLMRQPGALEPEEKPDEKKKN
jgi:outer membrane protein assembly factor BamB